MKKSVGILFLGAMFATAAIAQDPVTFTHEPPACVSSTCGQLVITGKVESSIPLQSVRVKFNDGSGAFYYVEMVHGGDWNFYAVLPSVLQNTSSVSYQIVAIAEDGTEIEGPAHTVPVTDDCPPTALTEDQAAYAANIALGLTDAAQSGDPVGFSCAGIVKVIDATGESMMDNQACEEARLAKTDPCLLAADREKVAGVPPGRAAAYTAAGIAIGVGGAISYDQTNDDKKPVSKARP